MFTQEDSTVIFFLFFETTTFFLSSATSAAPEGTESMAQLNCLLPLPKPLRLLSSTSKLLSGQISAGADSLKSGLESEDFDLEMVTVPEASSP